MPDYTIYETTTGAIRRTLSIAESMLDLNVAEDESVLAGAYPPGAYYVTGGEAAPIPPAPHAFCDWSPTAVAWVDRPDALAAVQAQARAAVDARRAALSTAPIAVDVQGEVSVLFDADEVAQRNVANKITELEARAQVEWPMPTELLVWRDAANQTHTWADEWDYRVWVQSLSVAMAERGTQLYVRAWAKKAEIDALTTVADVLAYDINGGW